MEPVSIVSKRNPNKRPVKRAPPSQPPIQFPGDPPLTDEPSLGRRQSMREKKPTQKKDLGYEEPKQLKNSKAAIREAKEECQKILEALRTDIAECGPIATEVVHIDQIGRSITSGHYKSTYQFGLDVRGVWQKLFTRYTGD